MVLKYVQRIFPGGEACLGGLRPPGYGPAHGYQGEVYNGSWNEA